MVRPRGTQDFESVFVHPDSLPREALRAPGKDHRKGERGLEGEGGERSEATNKPPPNPDRTSRRLARDFLAFLVAHPLREQQEELRAPLRTKGR